MMLLVMGKSYFFVNCTSGCYFVISEMKLLTQNLFCRDETTGLGDKSDKFLHDGSLGKGFVRLCDTKTISYLPINHLVGRVLLIPTENYFYGSDVLASYQHD